MIDSLLFLRYVYYFFINGEAIVDTNRHCGLETYAYSSTAYSKVAVEPLLPAAHQSATKRKTCSFFYSLGDKLPSLVLFIYIIAGNS